MNMNMILLLLLILILIQHRIANGWKTDMLLETVVERRW